MRVFGGAVVVTYALRDEAGEDDVPGAGNGFVDLFDVNGIFVRRLASRGSLNSPWGIAVSPRNFGRASNSLLIGNFGDGRISVFTPRAFPAQRFVFVGFLGVDRARPLVVPGLWALRFGNGAGGLIPNQLYFTAGPANETHGLFGRLAAVDGGGGPWDYGGGPGGPGVNPPGDPGPAFGDDTTPPDNVVGAIPGIHGVSGGLLLPRCWPPLQVVAPKGPRRRRWACVLRSGAHAACETAAVRGARGARDARGDRGTGVGATVARRAPSAGSPRRRASAPTRRTSGRASSVRGRGGR